MDPDKKAPDGGVVPEGSLNAGAQPPAEAATTGDTGGSGKRVTSRVTLRELLAKELSKDKKIVGGKVDGKVVDVHTPFELAEGTKVEPIRASDPEGLRIIRHSTAHVLADAVQRLFPGTKVTIGPATAAGFYYDFDKPSGPFTDEDLAVIEAKMREIVAAGRPFVRELTTREEAHKLFEGLGESYKRELIDAIPAGEDISLYRHGDGKVEWVDLCEGPHVPNTSALGAVKLISVAGAYWRGDERNPMLQRIYGTAFPTQKELEEHLKLIAEAKERDHRKLGKELELFLFHEYAPAMPFLLPRGAAVYNGLVAYMRDLYVEHGYEEVITPQIFDKRLFETSGHLPHYRENMYLPVTADLLDQAKLALRVGLPGAGDAEAYQEADAKRDAAVVDHLTEVERLGQKPMNCPSHCLIFGQRRRSYRELPWRIADFGRLHRYERGGVVHGLARVRSFCQDDAHIFCSPAQMQDEIQAFLKLLLEVYFAFKFPKIDIKLATRPQKRIGSEDQWDQAESALAEALKAAGLTFEIAPGEGAFYGPKLEFHVEDALKRSWQLGTIQVDYALPDRFGLEFVGQDGATHRPVMLHRAILGSLERFLSVYIEHTGGAFPVWLAPEHAVIVTVSEKQNEYAKSVVAFLASKGLRAKADLGADKLGAKIRAARLLRVPYVVVVGDREAAERKVAPRSRDLNADLGPMPLEAFADRLLSEATPPRLHANPANAANPANQAAEPTQAS
jgi:threonyl-tRNA synthetase